MAARPTFPGGWMNAIGKLLAAGSAAAVLAGCMHNRSSVSSSAGDITVDSLSATRTAILRVENNNPSEVRVYTVIGGKENYVAKAMPGETRTFVLDPNLFPAKNISFTAKSADGTNTKTLGPYTVNKNETVDLVVPTDFAATRTSIHKSMP
ncbi:MAG TPA: hypothetical protein VGM50_10190 [Gemmatimonadaceae bacterium]